MALKLNPPKEDFEINISLSGRGKREETDLHYRNNMLCLKLYTCSKNPHIALHEPIFLVKEASIYALAGQTKTPLFLWFLNNLALSCSQLIFFFSQLIQSRQRGNKFRSIFSLNLACCLNIPSYLIQCAILLDSQNFVSLS